MVSAIEKEDCAGACTNLKTVLAEDADDLLSLVQTKAVATRNGAAATHNGTTQLNQSSDAFEITPNLTVEVVHSKDQVNATLSLRSTEASPVLYAVIAVFIIVVIVHWSWLWHQQSQDDGKKHNEQKMKYGVDHLVVASEQTPGLRTSRAQLKCDSGVPKEMQDGVDQIAENTERADSDSILGEALDTKLVLPLRETWYATKIENVLDANGSFEILRITGNPSLRASIRYGSNHSGVVELFCGMHFLARATTEEPAPEDKPEACRCPLALLGPEERCLGELRPLSCKEFKLMYDGKAALKMVVNDAGQLEVLSMHDASLACVSCVAGHLAIFVNASEDTGLIVLIALAAVLLGGAGPHIFPKGWVKH